jgi:hypothetical protein
LKEDGDIKTYHMYNHDNEAALLHCISYEKRNVIKTISFICSSKYPKPGGTEIKWDT